MENELEKETLETELENETLENEPSEELKTLQEENKKLKEENEKAKKDFQTVSAQKEHFREKLEKVQPKEQKETPSLTDATNPLELVKLAKAFSDYDADEVEFITNHAKSSKTEDLLKSANDEWVKRAIKARREEIEKEKKTPSPSSPGSTIGLKSPQETFSLATDNKITDEKIEEITRKAFDESRKSGGKSGA